MSSIDSILQDIENNPVQELTVTEDNTDKPIKISVDLETRKKIIFEWLNGASPKDIGNKYNLSTRAINSIIDNNEATRLEIEKRYLATVAAREILRISETKDRLITYINDALTKAMEDEFDLTPEKRIKFLNNIASMFDRLDNSSRLNANKPTSLSEHRDIKVDFAEILKQINTPEDKKAFLQKQISMNNNK